MIDTTDNSLIDTPYEQNLLKITNLKELFRLKKH